MNLLKTSDVTLYELVETGRDAFNAPVYTETPVNITGVLICPVSTEGIVDGNQLLGKRQEYELCIPKTDNHIWENRTVEFEGSKWKTFGFVQEWMEANTPGTWNKKVKIKRYG